MGSGCRKTISWKNYYIKLKPRFLKTIFNFMILIFAAIMWVLRWCQPYAYPSSGHPKGDLDISLLRAERPPGPQKWILWHSPLRSPCAPRQEVCGHWHTCLNHVHLPTNSQFLSPDPENLPLQRKMGPAHKFFLHMVRESKQVNKFLNAFLWPGIINTLSCYHD